ncbi:MAG: GNAT family protein [Candidatus Velthaea sp.]
MPTLTADGIVLRAVERTDLDAWRTWVNDPEIAGYLDRVLPVSRPEHEQFFELAVVNNAKAVWFGIDGLQPPRYIGNIWLWDIDVRHRRAEVRVLIGDRGAWGTGAGSTSLRLITDYAFAALGLQKLYAYVMDRNPRAVRAFEKAGYREEARLESEAYWNGERHDVLRFAAFTSVRGAYNPPTIRR